MPELLPIRDCRSLPGHAEPRWIGDMPLPGPGGRHQEVLVIAQGDAYWAMPARCPHEGHSLAECRLDPDGRLVCPAHGMTLHTRGPACDAFPVRRLGEDFFVVAQPAAPAAGRESPESLQQAIRALEGELAAAAAGLEAVIARTDAERERLAAENRELASANAFYRRAIETMGELFVLLQPDGSIRQVNAQAEEQLACPAAQLEGGWLEDFLAPGDRASLAGRFGPGPALLLAAIRASQGRYVAEHALACPLDDERGRGRVYQVRGTLLHGRSGKIEGAVILASDIGHLKEVEIQLRLHRDHLAEMVAEQTRDLRAAVDAAEKANRAKSEFLANVSHELRTPMHAILSFSEMGHGRAGSAPAEKIAGYFDRIRQSGRRLIGLIDDLLDVSKLEAGRVELRPEPTDVAALLKGLLQEIRPLAAARALTLETAVEGDGQARVDRQRFSQVLLNVLSNAIRFSPEGGRVEIRLAPAELPAGRRAGDGGAVPALRIDVADQGPGIPDEDMEASFDKFVQSSRTRTGAGGTGLGLAISREIMDLHRGRITARHAPGGGALIEILVPRD